MAVKPLRLEPLRFLLKDAPMRASLQATTDDAMILVTRTVYAKPENTGNGVDAANVLRQWRRLRC
jgi:hypothetical protein